MMEIVHLREAQGMQEAVVRHGVPPLAPQRVALRATLLVTQVYRRAES